MDQVVIDNYDRLHNMAMSDDNYTACTGRILKSLWPVFIEISESEERREEPFIVSMAVTTAAAMIVGSQVQGTCRKGSEMAALEVAIGHFTEVIKSYVGGDPCDEKGSANGK
jgi:hypothetical protein